MELSCDVDSKNIDRRNLTNFAVRAGFLGHLDIDFQVANTNMAVRNYSYIVTIY
jgi:hypothetical protein